MKKPILLVADYAHRPLTRDTSALTLDLLESEKNNKTDRILQLIKLIKENGGNFLLQVIDSRSKALNIELTDASQIYLMLVFGIDTPGKSSLVMHSIYMANKRDCDTAKINDSFYRVDLDRLINIFPDGIVSEADFEMLWVNQKSSGDGTSGSGGNLVDKFDSYYYGN